MLATKDKDVEKGERDVGIICVIIYDDLALQAWTQSKGEREKGIPVQSSSPDGSCLRKTTRFPRYLPAKRMTTVPGVKLLRNLVGL